MSNALILTAAGNSTRMGGSIKKEYLPLSIGPEGTASVISEALYIFLSTNLFKYIIITVPSLGEAEARRVIAADARIKQFLVKDGIDLLFTEGGLSRQESVRRGLELLMSSTQDLPITLQPEIVLIHDGARPWIKEATIRAVLEGTRLNGASVPAVNSVDTQKETDGQGKILRHLDRSRVVSVQTPQGFRFLPLYVAHRQAAEDGSTYTDDTEIWGRYAGDVFICEGDRENRKITYQGDI